MSGTAINNLQYADSIFSRYAENSMASTSDPCSLATKLLGGWAMSLPWKNLSQPEEVDSLIWQVETNIEITKEAFEYLVRTIADPPPANPKLTRLLQSASK